MKKFRSLLRALCLPAVCAALFTSVRAEEVAWQPWSDDLFVRAKAQHKLVILDLEAVWCHWCHVMDKNTYSDAAVQKLLGEHYIAVRVDQDSRPDLSNRYEDYGWPATIVFSPDGKELAKRSGYIPPIPMASMLQAFVDDPRPGPSVTAEDKLSVNTTGQLSDKLKSELEKSFQGTYDGKLGGWSTVHKYLDADAIELCLQRAAGGDEHAAEMAKKTLDANVALIDPAWGGVYQYSVEDWKQPHYEKIMALQAANIEMYALAYSLWKRPADLDAAKNVAKFLTTFLSSPDGSFFTSQDADLVRGQHSADYFELNDADRRKKGIPVIDQHKYARENGWAIHALCTLYAVTGDKTTLERAKQAYRWTKENRARPDGGFRHDEKDAAGPYLGDSLSMARAALGIYTATADRHYLSDAEQVMQFIGKTFKDSSAGFFTAASHTAGFSSKPERDENETLARTAQLLFHYTGQTRYKEIADHAMKFLTTPQIARRGQPAGVLLTELELAQDPAHITIIASKNNPDAWKLFNMGLAAFPLLNKRLEWWDTSEGKLPNPDVEYPVLSKPAAFVCANQRCSLPLFTVEKLQAKLNQKN